ncbi:hypothetical protein H072_11334 [Dactylellina haptotyla CBS 200.50]|uniref:Inositol polyphosphate-related phosphatase domain-containing protein n=1 Tax=Dactylellina haptotyla (strain CBS 200.50) TaxID=1284197 RepID=S8A297_DACHA|nr:hypothetical protein H072_11334 [Dactylellina haptotyla CBS 200.50]
MAATRASDPGRRRSLQLEKLVGGPVAAHLYMRSREFLRRDTCTIKVTTWNVAAMDGTPKDLGALLRDSNHRPTDGQRAEGKPEGTTEGTGGNIAEGSPEADASNAIEGGLQSAVDPGSKGEGGPDIPHQAGRDIPYPEDRPEHWRISAAQSSEGGRENQGQEGQRTPRQGIEGSQYASGVGDDQPRTSRETAVEQTHNIKYTGKPAKNKEEEAAHESLEGGHRRQHDLPNCIQVICLQEVVDVTAPENFIRSADEALQRRWQDEIQAALPDYRCLIVQQLVGILMFIYVSPDIASQITTPSSTTVGTGLMGYMGNKGGALGRLVIGGLPAAGISPPSYADKAMYDREPEDDRGVTVVFVNSHLAAFANAVDRRNWDFAEIQKRAFFHPKPLPISGGGSPPEAVAAAFPSGYPFNKCNLVIWAGDLNYRLDMPGNEIRRILKKFLPPEMDGSDPVVKLTQDDNANELSDDDKWKEADRNFDETTEYLLLSDQLRKQQELGKAFQYYHEGKISFVPTYKYDVGTVSAFDTSEKARVPSYCDRILWKDWRVELEEIGRGEARKLADARDKERESHLEGMETTDVLFDFVPDDEDGGDAGEEGESTPGPRGLKVPKAVDHEISSINEIDISDVESPLKLLKYVSHQSVTTSDHKPVTAEFTLNFMAVDQEKRSQIQIEVVKELDRRENESRPVVTVIVDGDSNNESVDFGEIAWDQVIRRTITVANTGRTAAVCEFVKRPGLSGIIEATEDGDFTNISADDANDPMAFGDDSSGTPQEEVSKAWLSAVFNHTGKPGPHTLQPGDAESVTLQVALPPRKNGSPVDYASLLRQLNWAKEELSDVLVLRVAHGQDKYIPVKAEFKPTFLGYALTDLLRVPDSAGGIRNNSKCEGPPQWSAPRELFRMTEYLLLSLRSIVMSEGGEGVRWTMLPGWPFVKETWGLADKEGEDDEGSDELTRGSVFARSALKRWIREALDCDKDWRWEEVDKKGFSEEDKCEAMAECLLDWLVFLKDGVLPVSLYGEVVKGVGGKAGADKILDMLPTAAPPVHANVFVYMTGFISEIISLLSPKQDGATTNNSRAAPMSPVALVKRLSASSRLTTTEMVKKNLLKEFSEAIVRRPPVMDGWRSETLEKREEERRISFLAAFVG